MCISIKESTTTSGIGAAVVAPVAGSAIGFLLLLSVIVVLFILFIRYVYQFTQHDVSILLYATRWRRSHRGSVRVKSKPLPPPKGLWLEKEGGGSQEDLEMEDLETADDEKDYYFEDPSNIGISR